MSESEADARGHFELEPEPVAPRLPGEVIVRAELEDLHAALAADFMIHAINCVQSFGDYHIALSGGSTPLPFYRRLMVDPAYRGLPWARTHMWMVDERRVPFEDERNNYSHIAGYLLDHSGMPSSHAHPIDAMTPDVAERYERELKEALAWREKGQDRLDFVLLGMGNDGHTASLFPHSRALKERSRFIVVNDGPEVTPPDRVTMTYPIINSARFIAVLVTGKGKREMIARIASGKGTPEELPILGVRPTGGSLRWYLDGEACP